MIFRALASALFACSVVLATEAAPAQDTTTRPAPDGQTAPSPDGDPAAARIKYLHDRLRITAEQEELWDKVGQAIRDNTQNLTPLLKERLRATTSGTAPELLHAYEALGQAQLDSLRNIIAVFEPLYAGLSESQKKIADAVLREGAQNAMMSGIPVVPPPFTSALAYPSLAYPSYWTGPVLPMTVHPIGGFHHFHGFIPPQVHMGRFHRR
jgi:periplasmic protein CpxP/Spy